jgi:YHS domain-containing protein
MEISFPKILDTGRKWKALDLSTAAGSSGQPTDRSHNAAGIAANMAFGPITQPSGVYNMTVRHASHIALAFLGLLGASAPAIAGPEVNTSTGIVIANGKPAPGLAVHGYDVVAYFTQGKPVKGESRFAVAHGAATYRFATQAHLDAFNTNPEKYVPAYGGYCAYGVSVNAKFDGNPENWKIVDGKLYLNLDTGIQQTWLKDVPGNVKKAEVIWPVIKDKAPADIK